MSKEMWDLLKEEAEKRSHIGIGDSIEFEETRGASEDESTQEEI